MKILKIIGHPVTVISTFLLILISGEAFGGPYILYLFLGLPHGADYALAASTGILLLTLALVFNPRNTKRLIKFLLITTGVLLLILSLYLFFQHDRLRYNYDTFIQTVPKFTLILFSICIVCCLLLNLIQLSGNVSQKNEGTVDSLRRT